MSSRFVSVHVVHPYSSIDVTAAWKKLRFILSVRSDFHIVDSLLIAVHAFVNLVSMSFSVDSTLLPRYVNLSVQHPTRHQLYGHLPPITKTIQVRRTRHAGHCWRSRDELIRDVLLWIPTHGSAKAGRPARTYIQQLCEDTGCCPEDLPRAMNDREEWRERVRDIRDASTIWWWWWWWFGRVFVNGPGDLGSIPGRALPKTLKMVLNTSLLNTQQYKVCIKGKVEQSRERSNAFPYTSVL